MTIPFLPIPAPARVPGSGLKSVSREQLTNQAQQPIASFTVRGRRVEWPCTVDDVEVTIRIVRFPRPNRPGEKLDNTGRGARVWTVRAVFNNSVSEPNINTDGVALYPDQMLKVMSLVNEVETGDLVTPTDGLARAKLAMLRRETPEESVDHAVLSLTFIEDNEDGVDAAAFSKPTVTGLTKIIQKTTFSAQDDEVFVNPVLLIREIGSNIEGLLLAPGRAADDMRAQGRILAHTIQSVGVTADAVATERSGQLPPSPRTPQLLAEVADRAASGPGERSADRPAPAPYRVKGQTNIYALAGEVGQPPEALLDLNPQIEDPMTVPVGIVTIYSRWPP